MGLLSSLKAALTPKAADLTRDALLDEAKTATGLSDFGGDDFVAHLDALIASAQGDGVLHPRGLAMLRATLLACLAQRLQFVAAKNEKGSGDALAKRPLVVVGLPRSGTTLLHRLLASDPGARSIPLWLGLDPWPPPDAAEWAGADPKGRRARAQAAVDATPDVMRIHEMGPELPEECTQLQRTSFDTLQFAFTRPLLSYQAAWLGKDHRDAYRHLREALALLEHGLPPKHWALKSPQHLGALDVLLEVFPDADVVCLHRDPLDAVGSWCSFTQQLWAPHTAGIEPRRIGEAALSLLSGLCERGQQVRKAQPRVLDLGFSELVKDPVAAAKRLHTHFGRELTPDAEKAFAAYVAAHPKGKKGTHAYAVEDFGLTRGAVFDRFAAYREELKAMGERVSD